MTEYRAVGDILFPDVQVIPKADHYAAAVVVLTSFRKKGEEGLVYSRGDWWLADDSGVWVKQSEQSVRKEVVRLKDLARWYGRPGEESRRIQMETGYMNAVFSMLSVVAAQEDFFDNPTEGMAFENGFLEPDTVTLRPIRRQDKVTSVLPHSWDPEAKCGPWLRFLGEVFGPDSQEDAQQKIQFLREWLGEVLARRSTKHRKVLLMNGRGRNGKSILADVVDGIFTRESVASVPPQYFAQTVKLGSLSQATINIVPDIPNRAIKDTGNFKAVVSGDPVMGEFKYKNPFTFRAECGHLFSCNELPRSGDHTEGFFSRMVVLSFNASFGNGPNDQPGRPKDVLLAELRACTPGIIRWAVEGSAAVAKRGYLFTPESSERVLRTWKENIDTVASFLKEHCEQIVVPVVPKDGTSGGKLYLRFKAYCEECGEKPLTRKAFESKLRQEGIDKLGRAMENGIRDYYWGVRLL